MATDNYLMYRGHTFSHIRQGSAKARFSESISLSTLPIDTLSVTVVEDGIVRQQARPNLPLWSNGLLADKSGGIISAKDGYGPIPDPPYTGDLSQYKYGEVVSYYHNNQRVCKFYLESIKQVGKWDWEFKCVSPIGVLNSSDHYGGMYIGEKVGAVIADIIGGVVPYTIDGDLADVEVHQWLPKSSRRNNLRDVLFASNAIVQYNSNGDLHFVQYSTVPEPYQVAITSFYMGGSVAKGTPATQAIVVEHNFVARTSDTVVTLYDGEASGTMIVTPKGASVNGVLVEFKSPMHSLACTGASILESNPNYAVISSTGYASLTGKSYTHTERQVVKDSDNKEGSSPNIVRAAKCTLVDIRTSKTALERVMAFYGYAYRVSVDLLITNQKCGDYISFVDPYGGQRVGYIETMDIVYSKEVKATCNIVCGFIPPYDVPMYLHREVFQSNTTWTVPEGVTQVRVVCIGGGYGGGSGHNGLPNQPSTGTRNSWTGHQTSGSGSTKYNNPGKEISCTKGGDGGEPGIPGQGGKVYSTTLLVEAGQSFNVVIGTGGAGGVGDNQPGSAGTATTFGSITSESGASAPNGFVEEYTGVTYAAPGGNGIKGQRGVDGSGKVGYNSFWEDYSKLNETYDVPSPLIFNGVSYVAGQVQDGVTAYSSSWGSANSSTGQRTSGAYRGLGGGAAAGVNGPSSGSESRLGATGAKPIKPAAATHRGNGGDAGHGGGGAGGAGGAGEYTRIRSDYGSGNFNQPSVASVTQGGSGGDGGNGAPGICFIYYYSPEEV